MRNASQTVNYNQVLCVYEENAEIFFYSYRLHWKVEVVLTRSSADVFPARQSSEGGACSVARAAVA